jgi:hypothetical protein
MNDQRADPVVLLVDDDEMERFFIGRLPILSGARSSRRRMA